MGRNRRSGRAYMARKGALLALSSPQKAGNRQDAAEPRQKGRLAGDSDRVVNACGWRLEPQRSDATTMD